MTTFIKMKLNKSDNQKTIDKYRVAVDITHDDKEIISRKKCM